MDFQNVKRLLNEDVAVGQNQWYHFGVGEFTTHFSRDFSGIGMFTAGAGF